MEIKDIAEDNIHGSETLSMELVKTCLNYFKSDLNFKNELDYLKIKKKEMVQLINVANLILNFKNEHDFINLINDLENSKSRAILSTKGLLKEKVVTISWSSLVQESLIINKDSIAEIHVLESRPKNEGIKFAEFLSEQGFNVKLYVDAAIYHAIDKNSTILVGMDAILEDLSLINKIGTYALALASKHKGSKFYSIGTKYKISKEWIEFINHPYNEIYLRNLNNQNYYFDITSSDLIDSYIMDFGIFNKSSFSSLGEILRKIGLDFFYRKQI
ncbi:MAG: hypothetical protein ACP5F1_01075 [Thermoplasmata archaeon]|nr:hypothetical protein [Thermoplasmata archaeon]